MNRSLSRALKAALVCLGVWGPVSTQAIVINITYTDGANEGFNDPTLGAQRKLAFQAGVAEWSKTLLGAPSFGNAALTITAHFDSLGGNATSAVGGTAGPNWFASATGLPFAGTYYPGALITGIANQDFYPGTPMIDARFNSDVDNGTVLGSTNWYYGTDGNNGIHIDFKSVVVHELGHGIGFLSLISPDGSYYNLGQTLPSPYDQFLAETSAANAVRLVSESAVQRGISIKGGSLWFAGTNARAANGGINARIYAPTTYQQGSSTSHLDQATYQNGPNSLMCPVHSNTIHNAGTVGNGVLKDIGWRYNTPPTGTNQSVTTPMGTPVNITLNGTDPDGQTLTYTTTPPLHGTLTSGTSAARTYAPAAGYTGPDFFTYKIEDTQAVSDMITVNITVTAIPKPAVTTEYASGITGNGATLNGSVDAQGASSTTLFSFGETTSYGAQIAGPTVPAIPAGSQPVSANVSILDPGKTYHYRAEATNAGGQTLGSDSYFVTPAIGSGAALSFAGTGESVLGDGNPIINALPITVSGWVNTTQMANGVNGIIGNFVQGAGNGYLLYVSGGNLYAVYFGSGGSVFDGVGGINAGPIADGAWHHVALTVDATGGILYVDGQPKGSLGWNGSPTPTTTNVPLLLGVFPPAGAYAGLLDDVRIYNIALTPAQIQQTMKSRLVGDETGLIAYYRLDEGVAVTARDSSPTGTNGGFYQGSPIWVPSTSPIGDAVAVTEPASPVDTTTATLNGSVNASGMATTYRFEYGADTSYGQATPALDAGSAVLPHTVSAPLTGLTSGMTYHYRLVATNAKGTFPGQDLTFSTTSQPDVRTGYASDITGTSAILHADVDAKKADTTTSFEWGNAGYGNLIAGQNVPAVPLGPQAITATLDTLTPGTTYHFRALATNASGTKQGLDSYFVTPAIGSGTALSFTGGGEGLIGDGNPVLNAMPITVSAWVKTNQTDSNINGILGNFVPGSADGYTVYLSEGNLRAMYISPTGIIADGGVGINGGPIAADGLWHHIALTVDTTEGTLYVDGQKRVSKAWDGTPGPPTTTVPLIVGFLPTVGAFAGLVDDVRIYNVAQTQAEIQQTMKSRLVGDEPGLITYLRMDEGVALIALDSSPTGMDGDFAGFPVWVPSDSPVGDAVPVTTVAEATGLTTATLQGTVNPGGLSTIYHFEFGTDPNTPIPTGEASAGAGIYPKTVGAALDGLIPGATYYARVVATNAKGVFLGQNLTFTTSSVFGAPDIARALQLAAGLDTATTADRSRLALPGVGEDGVDLMDAIVIARKVNGLDTNP